MRILTLQPAGPIDVAWTVVDSSSNQTSSGIAPAGELPIDGSSIDEAHAEYVFGLLEDMHGAFVELHRLLRPEGLLYATVAHASSSFAAWRDPATKRQFTSQTFRWFERYPPAFKVDAVRLKFIRDDPTTHPGMGRRWLAGPLERIANRHNGTIHRAERYWGNVLGFEEMQVIMRVIKDDPDPL